MNDDFERELQEALHRKDPSADFEARVLAAAGRDVRVVPIRPRGLWRWVTPLAAGVVLTAGIAWQRERAAEEQVAGETAKARLELALKITSAKLHRIHEKLEASE